ncbi:MAG: hypothetical protein ACU0B1_02030 [Thermohalobaculum sp.]
MRDLGLPESYPKFIRAKYLDCVGDERKLNGSPSADHPTREPGHVIDLFDGIKYFEQ